MPLHLSPDVLSARLAAETVLLDMGSKNYFQLNSTAAEIWDALERGCTVEQVVEQLVEAYEAPREEVEAEARRLLAGLIERKLVVESE